MKHQINSSTQTLELFFPGDVLSTNAEQIRHQIKTLLETAAVQSVNWQTLRLDLSAAKLIDSVGLNLIVGLYKEAKKRGAKTCAVLQSENLHRIFLFTRLDSHIQVIQN